MKCISRGETNEMTFGDIQVANGFIYLGAVCLKVIFPQGVPGAVELETGKGFVLAASTFVKPIDLEATY